MMSDERPGSLDPARLFGAAEGTPLAGTAVIDFWRWAHSNVLNNTSRGRLAEFLVAKAVSAAAVVANEWDTYDLETPSGIRLEVKSSAYVQDWAPPRRPPRPTFSIRPTVGWDRTVSAFVGDSQRHADVYVFCLLTEQERSRVDPLDISQWRFYVVPSTTLDRECGTAKTISLNRLARLALPVPFAELDAAITAAN